MSEYFLGRLRLLKDICDELETYFESRKPYGVAFTPPKDDATNFDFDESDGCFVASDGMDPDELIDTLYQMNNQSVSNGVKSVACGIEEDLPLPKLKEGSISKRKDGRWMGRYYLSGIMQPPIYAKTERDIIAKLNQAIVDRDRQAQDETRMRTKKATLYEAIHSWFEEWKLAKSKDRPLSSKTIQNVEYSLVKYVCEHKLSKKELGKITFQDLDAILDSVPTKSMQARVYGYLKLVYKRLQLRTIIRVNPMDQLDPRVRPKAKKKWIPSSQEWLSFLEWLKINNDGVYYFAKFLANTGLRKGEALALKHKDIDITTQRIRVNKSYSDLEKKAIDHPKTDSGVRDVPIFEEALEVLSSIPRDKKNDEIFWMVSKSNITHTFPNLAKRFGFARLTLHDLRHLFASKCHQFGVDKKTYSMWMGHADTDMTDGYTHVTDEFENEEIKKMANNSHPKKKV